MYLEIGGMQVFNSDKKGAGLKINSDKKYSYLLNCCRNAERLILKLENISKVYVCEFNCDTVITPLFDNNLDIETYYVDRNFQIKNLIEKLNNETHRCAVIIQNYFASYNLNTIKHQLRKKNVIIIEDITQCALDYRKFENSDYYIGSIRKWASSGEGGILLTDKKLPLLPINDGKLVDLYSEIAPIQKEYNITKNQTLKTIFRQKQTEFRQMFDNQPIQTIDNRSLEIVNNIDYEYIKKRRRENFNYLVEQLKKFSFIQLPIQKLDENSVPLYLPIYVKNRKEFQQFFVKYDIYNTIIWTKDYRLSSKYNDETNYIYDNILCIFIDQRYGIKDMKRIIEVMLEYEKVIKF